MTNEKELHNLVELWKSNKDHLISESIEGFPTGNVYVGMTAEDYFLIDDIIDELMSKSSEFKKPELIVWHPYPKEKPSDDMDECLVLVVETPVLSCYITSFMWLGEDDGGWGEGFDHMVKAWAEVPEPYKEE